MTKQYLVPRNIGLACKTLHLRYFRAGKRQRPEIRIIPRNETRSEEAVFSTSPNIARILPAWARPQSKFDARFVESLSAAKKINNLD
jgi:hypothetical protein